MCNSKQVSTLIGIIEQASESPSIKKLINYSLLQGGMMLGNSKVPCTNNKPAKPLNGNNSHRGYGNNLLLSFSKNVISCKNYTSTSMKKCCLQSMVFWKCTISKEIMGKV